MSNPADHTATAAELARLRQQAGRERKARLEAERIAEQATRQLYDEKASLLLLQAITGAANEANTFEEAMGIALDRICAHTGWPVGHVYLLSEGTTGDLVSARHFIFINKFPLSKFTTTKTTNSNITINSNN